MNDNGNAGQKPGANGSANGSNKSGPQRLGDTDLAQGAKEENAAKAKNEAKPPGDDDASPGLVDQLSDAFAGAFSGSGALASAKEEAEKFKNEYLYLRAEFENFKRQAIKERSDLRKFGSERLIAELLGVLDILETALSTEGKALQTTEGLANFRKGIEMTATELRSTFSRHGVTEVPSKGQPFDPAVHEAVTSEESDEQPPGTVTQVFKKPYKLHDRVIRPGQVVVAKAKA